MPSGFIALRPRNLSSPSVHPSFIAVDSGCPRSGFSDLGYLNTWSDTPQPPRNSGRPPMSISTSIRQAKHSNSRRVDPSFITVNCSQRTVRCYAYCAAISAVIQTNHSSLPPKGKPEFHAEWLRDGPCDATTTCLGKPGVWCQLSLASARNMRFGGRFSTLSGSGSQGDSSQLTFAQFLSRSRARISAVTCA